MASLIVSFTSRSAIIIFNAEFVFYILFDYEGKSVEKKCVYSVVLHVSKFHCFLRIHALYFAFGGIANLTYTWLQISNFFRTVMKYHNNMQECREGKMCKM